MAKHLPQALKDKISSALKSGMKNKDAIKKYKVSHGTVARIKQMSSAERSGLSASKRIKQLLQQVDDLRRENTWLKEIYLKEKVADHVIQKADGHLIDSNLLLKKAVTLKK